MEYVIAAIVIFVVVVFYMAKKEDNNTKQKTTKGKIKVTWSNKESDVIIKDSGVYVKKREKPSTLAKSKRGLYPHEILMLSYVNKFHTGKNNFQSFWYYKYDVENPQNLLNKLVSEGFVELDNDICTVLEKETVAKLKSVLSSCGQKVSGRKEELIHRIIEKVPAHVVEREFPLRYYRLTEKGEAELSENSYVVHCHRNNIDMWDIATTMHNKNLSYRDAIFGLYNKLAYDHLAKQQFFEYYHVKCALLDFYTEEKNYQQAFVVLCEVLLYNLNGVEDLSLLYGHEITKEFAAEDFADSAFPYKNDSCILIDKHLLSSVKELQRKLDVSDEEYSKMMLFRFHHHQIPFYVFTDEECVDIVFAEMYGDIPRLEAIYKTAEKRFSKNNGPFFK